MAHTYNKMAIVYRAQRKNELLVLRIVFIRVFFSEKNRRGRLRRMKEVSSPKKLPAIVRYDVTNPATLTSLPPLL